MAWCGSQRRSWGISAEMGLGGASCHPSARELQKKVGPGWVAPRSWEATVTVAG